MSDEKAGFAGWAILDVGQYRLGRATLQVGRYRVILVATKIEDAP